MLRYTSLCGMALFKTNALWYSGSFPLQAIPSVFSSHTFFFLCKDLTQPFPVCGVATRQTREMLDQQEALICQAPSSPSPYPSGDTCISASRQELPAPPCARPQPSALRSVFMGMASTTPDMALQGFSVASS